MFLIKIILGLIGLGVVVFVHELGHFLAAKLCGIDVEAFSIGWGNPILRKKIGGVEYRIGMFPVGGYCKMRGDNDYREVWDNTQKGIMPAGGSFFAASPGRRILVAFAGPFFNLIFAVIALAIIWGAGFQVTTLSNRIILASEVYEGEQFPADEAGLETGDRIVEIDGKKINWYHEIQEYIAINPDKQIPLVVERGNEILNLSVRPELDKSTAAGRIGVISWVDPVIESVASGGAADIAGLKKGDVITGVNGQPVRQSMDLAKVMETKPPVLQIEYARNGAVSEVSIHPEYSDNREAALGINWTPIYYDSPALSFPAAVAKGAGEAWNTLTLTLRSFGLLFKGIDLTQAVSGPVRITYMMGDVAAEGFGQSVGSGFRSLANFLALISIALCVMNLLPLPVLDGGMIILCIVEMIRRKPLNPKAASVFQAVGVVFIAGLMLFAVFGDILYLIKH